MSTHTSLDLGFRIRIKKTVLEQRKNSGTRRNGNEKEIYIGFCRIIT